MKWYNKERTVCLDLDKIAYWIYYKGELRVWIGGIQPIIFADEQAESIYNMLTITKEIL